MTFKKLGISLVIDEFNLNSQSLIEALAEIETSKAQRIKKIKQLNL